MLAMSAAVSAAVITEVVRADGRSGNRSPIGEFDGNTAPLPMPEGGLHNGTDSGTPFVFSDRTFWWEDVPEPLTGADYIRTFNDDKEPEALNVTYTVTTSSTATVWIAFDNRLATQSGNWIPAEDPLRPWGNGSPESMQQLVDWLTRGVANPGTFSNTGLTLGVRESSSTRRTFIVYAATLPAGTVVFRHQSNRNTSNYVIGAVPEVTYSDFRAYNDCIRGVDDNTAENVTNWTVYDDFTDNLSGPLLDFATGQQTPVVATFTWDASKGLAISETSGSEDGISQPRPGTPAYEVFGEIVDFSNRCIYYGSSGWWVEVTFTGLNPASQYTFVTTAIRARIYTDRLTLFTLSGHTSAVNTSSDGVYQKDGDQTVLMGGGNHLNTAGDVVRWDNICVPDGGDGTGQFTVRAEAYGSNYRAYPFGGFMLEQLSNTPPTVDAGGDRMIHMPSSYMVLEGQVSDDGAGDPHGFLESVWSQISGPASVEFVSSVNQPSVMVHFPMTGAYQLRLSATDGQLSSWQDVTVTVGDPVCPFGDLDRDCRVTLADLELLALGWLEEGASLPADLTGNWRVDMEELNLLAQSWQDDWTGALQVTIYPAEAVAAGARWRVDGGAWLSSGDAFELLAEGEYLVEYSVTPQWVRPDAQKVTIVRQETTSISGEYYVPPQTLVISEFMAVNSDISGLRPSVPLNLFTVIGGEPVYEDWIELHNLTDETVSLDGWYLTDSANNLTRWQFPAGYSIGPRGYFVVYASKKEAEKYGYPFADDLGKLHTNFALSQEGEYLAIVRPDGQWIEYAYETYPKQRGLVSYGIGSNGLIGYQTGVTFEAANTGIYEGVAAEPSFSVSRGFYEAPFLVQLACSTPDAVIRYTTDTSEPAATTGIVYNPAEPIRIASTTCLRAAAFKDGYLQSTAVTHTYIFLENVLVQATDSVTGEQTVPEGYPATWPGGSYTGPVVGDYQVDPDIASPTGLFGPLYAATLKDDLKAIPSVSLVVPIEQLFSAPMGIYTHQSQDGTERAGSVEFIDPAGVETFYTNCGVRMQGGVSTGGTSLHRWKYWKLSFRLRFRGVYGGSLSYPVFGEGAAKSFDNLILRARSNNTWLHPDEVQRRSGDYVRDQVASDVQLKMEGYACQGRPVHVYVNGMYWGLYWLQERPDHAFAASYLGGEKEDYDVIKHDSSNIVNGSNAAYLAMFALSASVPDFVTAFDNLRQTLDVEDFIDYLIANFYLGSGDWDRKNWYASFNRFDLSGRWRWHMWDAEHIMDAGTNLSPEDVTNKNTSLAPTGLHQKWLANPEYRMLFADRVHRHLFNGGVLTPDKFAALFTNLTDKIDRAIVGESARWGDNRRPATPYTRDVEWLTECNRLLDAYIPGRRDVVLSQFTGKNPPWYPSVAAPVFLINELYQYGGDVIRGDVLTILNPNDSGTVYYTLNGSDPRLPGGGVNSSALIYTGDIPVRRSLRVAARVLRNGIWSALNEANYSFGPLSLLHYWHFNTLSGGTIVSVPADYTILGESLITYPGTGTGYMDTTDGSDVNVRLGQDAGECLRVRNPSETRQLVLALPTTGYESLQLSYAVMRTVNGAQSQTVEYRTRVPGDWEPICHITVPETYERVTVDLSDIPGVSNNPDFSVRILFGGSNASGASGNNRFDNIVLEGVPMDGTNSPPQPVKPLPFSRAIENEEMQIALSDYYIDPDGDTLSFSAASDKTFVAGTTIVGDTLVVMPQYRGDAAITVAADDGVNPPVVSMFRVLVYPAAQPLQAGAFHFDEWSPLEPEHSFPEGMLFLQSDVPDPALEAPLEYAYFIPHDGDDGYHTNDLDKIGFPYMTTGRSRINGLNTGGISFINTGRQRDLGGALAAVDTTGFGTVRVSWLGGTVLENVRRYAIRLQCRVGADGLFTDIMESGQPVEYMVQSDGHTHLFGSVELPAVAVNQPYVQLLWKYYCVDGTSGARAQLRLDDIAVSGVPNENE